MGDALAVLGGGTGLEQALTLSTRLAKSGLIPRALQNKPDDVLVVLLRGQELGLGPMQALAGIHVIEGKGVCSADLIVALCAKRRDVCEFFRLVESTEKRAVYETKRAGAPEPTRISFTIEEAARAKLTGKDNWQKYPAAMLRARCSTALARAVYPDLAMGLYDTDEAEDFHRPAMVHPIQSPQAERQLNAPPPKPKVQIIDVAPGETEQQAEVRAKTEAPKETRYQHVKRIMSGRGVAEDVWRPVLKEKMAPRTTPAQMTDADVAAVLAAFPEPPEKGGAA